MWRLLRVKLSHVVAPIVRTAWTLIERSNVPVQRRRDSAVRCDRLFDRVPQLADQRIQLAHIETGLTIVLSASSRAVKPSS